jgi:hypothetical protein
MPYQDLLLTVVPILFGIAIKYRPELKNVPNALIPYVGFALALVTKLAENQGLAPAGYVQAGFWGAAGGFLAPVLSAGWTAIQNSLVYEVFLRNPVGAVLRKP